LSLESTNLNNTSLGSKNVDSNKFRWKMMLDKMMYSFILSTFDEASNLSHISREFEE
jgi:hypothetical protein